MKRLLVICATAAIAATILAEPGGSAGDARREGPPAQQRQALEPKGNAPREMGLAGVNAQSSSTGS